MSVNLHKLIYDALNGRNASVAIVCNPQTVTLTPAAPLSVPTGLGFDGRLNAVTVKAGDPAEVTFHTTLFGLLKKDVVKKL